MSEHSGREYNKMTGKLLRQYVIDELDFDPSFDSANVGVAVENGVVTLTGHVGSYAEKIAAEKAAQRVKGVHAVAQEIEVRYPEQKKTADDQIAERAVAIIGWDAMVNVDAVMVKVQKGWVTLTGNVEWQYQRTAAESAIRRLSGVIGVTNLIEVKPRIQPQNIKAKIMEALKRNAELEADSIRVTVKDDKVTLEGRVKAWFERGIAERAAWSAPGVKSVEDRLSIS
jgi:osmotically-inducible protein OsmY